MPLYTEMQEAGACELASVNKLVIVFLLFMSKPQRDKFYKCLLL